jgi:small subunit ribosomal protein S16
VALPAAVAEPELATATIDSVLSERNLDVSVKIRLMRVGKKKQPTYRVVVADSHSPRDGRFIEIIGQYGPRQEPSHVQIDGERALSWLRNGAQPTEQVQKLLTATGVWAQFESEKGGRVDTKLARRRLTDTAPSTKKKSKQAAGKPEAAEAPAAIDEAADDAPSDEVAAEAEAAAEAEDSTTDTTDA